MLTGLTNRVNWKKKNQSVDHPCSIGESFRTSKKHLWRLLRPCFRSIVISRLPYHPAERFLEVVKLRASWVEVSAKRRDQVVDEIQWWVDRYFLKELTGFIAQCRSNQSEANSSAPACAFKHPTTGVCIRRDRPCGLCLANYLLRPILRVSGWIRAWSNQSITALIQWVCEFFFERRQTLQRDSIFDGSTRIDKLLFCSFVMAS